MAAGKLVIFSAPSGCGKSTLIRHLLAQVEGFSFSISCTSRRPRGEEQDGREYYFLTPEEFRRRIERGDFLEYEEVYRDIFYGTLKSEVERIAALGHNVIFDVDVHGGLNIKRHYGDRALTIFVRPPSIDALRERLVHRGTDAPDIIERRLERAAYELSRAGEFDRVVINDDLATAKAEVVALVQDFLQ